MRTPVILTILVEFCATSFGSGFLANEQVFRVESRDAYLVELHWSERIKPGFSISYREEDQTSWVSLSPVLPIEGSPRLSYNFQRRDPCIKYEFRIQGWLEPPKGSEAAKRQQLREIRMQRTVHSKTPQRIEALVPKVIGNVYEEANDSVRISLTWEVDALHRRGKIFWPPDLVRTRASVHIVGCDHGETLPIPIPRLLNGSTYLVQFPRPYFSKIVEHGGSCQSLFLFEPEASACGQIVQVRDELKTNSVLMEINCDETENLPCSYKALQSSISKPNCNPDSVTTQQLPGGKGVLVRWDFGNRVFYENPIPGKKKKPIKIHSIHFRFGLTNPPTASQSDQAALFGFVPITEELGQEELPGDRKGTILHIDPVPGEHYRISICATFESRGGASIIKWDITPNFPIIVGKQKRTPVPNIPLEEVGVPNLVTTTSLIPGQGSCSGGDPPEFNWRPVILTVGLFSLANIILLFMSCFLYSRARKQQMTAQKSRLLPPNQTATT